MGIETKYEYVYYTAIVSEQWRRGNEDVWGDDGFSWHNACKFIQTKFEENESGNSCFKVSEAHYCDDIDGWRRAVIRNKHRPVFVQFQEDQPIMTTGEGCFFILYIGYKEAEDDGWDEDDGDEGEIIMPDIDQGSVDEGSVDGLAGAGGRL
jgi:hypothetical protein